MSNQTNFPLNETHKYDIRKANRLELQDDHGMFRLSFKREKKVIVSSNSFHNIKLIEEWYKFLNWISI
jgi:hypothetical protein